MQNSSPQKVMNAPTSRNTLDNATPVDIDPRSRRGPFRPEKLISTRERRSGDMFVRLFRILDVMALIALGTACALPVATHDLMHTSLSSGLPFLLVTALFIGGQKFGGLYNFSRNESLIIHVSRLFCALAVSFGAGLLLAQALSDAPKITQTLFNWLFSATAAHTLLHGLWHGLVSRWRKQGRLTPNIVIVGATKHAETLIEAAIARQDVNILGIFDDRMARNPVNVAGVPVLGDINALLTHKITPYVDQIVVTLDTSAKARVESVVEKLRILPNQVSLIVDVDDEAHNLNTALTRLGDMPLARVSGISEDERRETIKRAQDLIIGTIALIVFAPIMVATAIAIKLDSPGPIFFRQRRHGFNNEAIKVWKFRSMYTHMTDHTSAQQITKGDPRVTKVGRFIRKTSLDELPQLLNVMAGEMSLVGPRPHAIGMKTGADISSDLVSEYAWRHRMKPGVTGWAAIKGSRGALDTAEDVRRRVALDVEYIDQQSLWLDIYIMAMTIPCLLGDAKTVR